MSKFDDFYLIDISFNGDMQAAPNGDFQTITGIENLKQALFNRLVTVPGTLVHRPNYGVGIKLWINKLYTIPSKRELALKIKNQFEQDFRVDSLKSVSFDDKENGKFIVKYSVLANGILIQGTFNPFGEFEI